MRGKTRCSPRTLHLRPLQVEERQAPRCRDARGLSAVPLEESHRGEVRVGRQGRSRRCGSCRSLLLLLLLAADADAAPEVVLLPALLVQRGKSPRELFRGQRSRERRRGARPPVEETRQGALGLGFLCVCVVE